VPDPPAWLAEHPSEEIDQGYVTTAEDATEVRVRRGERGSVLAVKRGSGLSRAETEIRLTGEQADALWPLTEGRRIRKRRHRVPVDGTTIEVDVYGDRLEGLSVGEVEFSSERASEGFNPPPWLGRELTDDPRYRNERLAEHGAPEEPA
jgi:CYTH domain-containing protein